MLRRRVGAALMVVGAAAVGAGVVGMLVDMGSDEEELVTAPTPTATTDPPSPSPTPTATRPSTEPDPSPSADAVSLVRALYTDMEQAAAAADVDRLLALVHPVVVEAYGEQQCRDFLTAFAAARPSFSVLEAGGPEPYVFDRDGLAVPVGDALTADVVITVEEGSLDPQEVHAASVDGSLRFFTDCGTPR